MSQQIGTSAFSRRSSQKQRSGRQRRYQQHLTPNYEPPTDESIQDESVRPLLSQNSAAEDFARHHSIEQSSISPNPNGLDQTENDVSAVEKDSDYELEQYEMEDRIGEIPLAFTRRKRRVSFYILLMVLKQMFLGRSIHSIKNYAIRDTMGGQRPACI